MSILTAQLSSLHRPPQAVPVTSFGIGAWAIEMGLVALMLALAALPAAVGVVAGWAIAGVAAVATGLIFLRLDRALLAILILPCTLLAGSAIVPYEGRYIPAAVAMGGLIVASRGNLLGGLRDLARRRALAVVLVAYLGWAAITTLTSIDRPSSAIYVAGLALSLTAAFAIVGPMLRDEPRLRFFVAALAIVGIVVVLFGWVLVLVGPRVVWGNVLGLYFIEELVLGGQPTGITFYQNYGPFVGPSTVPLAFGIAAAVYLSGRVEGTSRWGWLAGGVVMGIGLFTTMSREGILMAAIAVGVVALDGWRSGRGRLAAPLMATALAVLFATSMAGTLSVSGRLDLVAQRYGTDGVKILMNPDLAERGKTEGADSGGAAGGGPQGPGGSSGAGGGLSGPDAVAGYPKVVDLKTASSLVARVSLWSAAIEATKQSPLLGYGLGTNAAAILPYLAQTDPYLRGATTHSTVFRTLVEMGIPGLILLGAFMLVAFYYAWRWARSGRRSAHVVLVACLLATAAHQLFGTMLLGGFEYTSWVLTCSVGVIALAVPAWTRATRGQAYAHDQGDRSQGMDRVVGDPE